ncbi:MAG: alpha/beta hydrolase [Actinomycetes bacterium]
MNTRDVDPDIHRFLDQLGGPNAPDLSDSTIADARASDLELMRMIHSDTPPITHVEDRTVPGPSGEVAIRVYRPSNSNSLPGILVWFHGGGWCLGSLESGDGPPRSLAQSSGAVVVSVDFRLAPEHPFPAGIDDCWSTVQWVAAHGHELGGDPQRLAVGGESSGGNLAALVAIKARDAGGPNICHQLLANPSTDLTLSLASTDDYATGYFLSKQTMTWFIDLYLERQIDRRDPAVSPLFTSDLSGVAPASVFTAGFDPLRDEGTAYVDALRRDGSEAQHYHYDSLTHAYFSMAPISPVANQALAEAGAVLRSVLTSD